MRITESKKSDFHIPADISYINCAYMSPLSRETVNAGKMAVELKAHPYRISPDDFFITSESIRSEFANLINGSSEQVAIVPSVSYGFASIASNISLKKGDEIIVVEEQFPSNIYIWKRRAAETGAEITIINLPDTNIDRGKVLNGKILSSITDKTQVVALGTVHWSDGTLFDLQSIRRATKEKNALMVLDGTQSVGAMPFHVEELNPDAIVVAGYKWLMCPYSTGFVWYGDYFKDGVPIEENWINRKDSSNFAGLVNYQDEYDMGARRFDMGEKSNFILNPMVEVALRQVNSWGPENIQDYCDCISKEAIIELKERGYWVEDREQRGSHLFGIRLPKGKDLEKIKLKCEQNKVFVSIRGSAIRVAPHVYNDVSDFEKLLDALK